MRTLFSNLFSGTLLVACVFGLSVPSTEAAAKKTKDFSETISVADLKEAYTDAKAGGDKVRILIMPGHEPDFGGAVFNGQYEREFVVDIAERLAQELSTDPQFEVLVARGNLGWNEDFTYYFDKQGRRIERFIEDHKEDMAKLEKRGKLKEGTDQAAHNAAREDVAQRLYGVSKWANDNDVDLVLHLHLNDETSHTSDAPGIHSGMAIYVPDSIYGNAKSSKAAAEFLFERLNTTNATSTFGVETKGIVESRDLIAVGAYNTAEMPSLLIEYGYLYEPRITNQQTRGLVFADYAHQSALGVKEFFGASIDSRYDTTVLPYQFASDVLEAVTASTTPSDAKGLFALQVALSELGFYPGTEASLSVCPISGMQNACTTEAVKAFQASKGLAQTGTLGHETRVALNSAFSLATPGIPAAPIAAVAPTSPTTSTSCSFTGSLAPEVTDADTKGEVTRLQALLAKDSSVYPEGTVSGYFGPATLAAVKRFQLKQGIVPSTSPAYGTVGPATKAALSTACSTSSS